MNTKDKNGVTASERVAIAAFALSNLQKQWSFEPDASKRASLTSAMRKVEKSVARLNVRFEAWPHGQVAVKLYATLIAVLENKGQRVDLSMSEYFASRLTAHRKKALAALGEKKGWAVSR